MNISDIYLFIYISYMHKVYNNANFFIAPSKLMNLYFLHFIIYYYLHFQIFIKYRERNIKYLKILGWSNFRTLLPSSCASINSSCDLNTWIFKANCFLFYFPILSFTRNTSPKVPPPIFFITS